MLLSELKLLFDSGQLRSCLAVNYALSNEWCLQFQRKGSEPILMNARRVSPRTFKILATTFKATREVGFINNEAHAQ